MLLGLACGLASSATAAFVVIFATSYSGAAIPSFLAGQFSCVASLLEIAGGYGVLAVLATIVTLIAARNPGRAEDERGDT